MRLLVLLSAMLAVTAIQPHNVEKRQARRTRVRSGSVQKKVEVAETNRVVCYYTNWSVYRSGLAKFTPENINPYLCTHLVYAFGGLTNDFEVFPFDSYQDIDKGGYNQFNALKQYNRGMKTLLAIGGWNEGSARFSELVAFPEYRKNFTISSIKHMRRYNFDGLDLDWEYPGSRDGSAPEDKENYAILVKELREAFNDEGRKNKKGRLLLTMAVPAGQNYIDKGYDIPTLNRYLDFFNLLSYDYHSSYEPSINHHAPLMAPPGTSEYEWNAKLNVDWTVKYYLSKGASKNKLVIGIPTYGRSFTLINSNFTEFGSSAEGPGLEGKYTKENGYFAFYEVCEAVAADKWTVRKPYPRRIGPYAHKGNQWVGYDDEHIVAKKAEYVSDTGLGGIMFWSVDSDDFRGICNGKQYPLIEAGKLALLANSANSENEAGRAFLATAPGVNQPTSTSSRRRRPTVAPIYDPMNTPEPPTTPTPVAGYTCKREGFYPDPENCHKYYWCLDSGTSGLGIVAHAFTCPSNLIFNKAIDGCDHPSQRLKCKTKKNRGGASKNKMPTTTAIPTTTAFVINEDYYNYNYYDDTQYEYIYEDELYPDTIVQDNKQVDITSNTVGDVNPGSALELTNEVPTTTVQSEISLGGRGRPQYTSIQRASPRTKTIEENEPLASTGAPPVVSRGNSRPQYTSLQRQRPQKITTEAPPEQVVDDAAPGPRRGGLNYVTIDRRRPATEVETTQFALELDTTTQGSLEYVTINRGESEIEDIEGTPTTTTIPVDITTVPSVSGIQVHSAGTPVFFNDLSTPVPEIITTEQSFLETISPFSPFEDVRLVESTIPPQTSRPSFTSIVTPRPRMTLSPVIPKIRPQLEPVTPITIRQHKPSQSPRPRPVITSPRPIPVTSTVRTRPVLTTTPVPRPKVIRTTPIPRSVRPRPTVPRTPRPTTPVLDYEYEYDYYYTDGSLGGTLGQLAGLTDKAILLPDGSVECYDTGYFPHPGSCKKFISCSKTVRGVVRGWVYTCPKRLVFDPVGGMCNWAEAVDCSGPRPV